MSNIELYIVRELKALKKISAEYPELAKTQALIEFAMHDLKQYSKIKKIVAIS